MSHNVNDAILIAWLNIQVVKIVAKYGQDSKSKKKKNANNKV